MIDDGSRGNEGQQVCVCDPCSGAFPPADHVKWSNMLDQSDETTAVATAEVAEEVVEVEEEVREGGTTECDTERSSCCCCSRLVFTSSIPSCTLPHPSLYFFLCFFFF